jgi:nucleoside-diphosphate-sugar epimerase
MGNLEQKEVLEMTKRISIIGSNSFLGKNLSDRMKHSEITEIGRNSTIKYSFPERSFADGFDIQKMVTSDVIIYCAGAGIQPGNTDSLDQIYELNAFEPIRLMNALQEFDFDGQVITFGSYFEIGFSVKKPYTEEQLIFNTNRKPNDYCISKSLLSKYIFDSKQDFKFNQLHFVLPNIYGAGENPKRLFPYVEECVRVGKSMEFTSGSQVRQFLHVNDVVDLVAKAVSYKWSGIYNLGCEPISVKHAIEEALTVFENAYEVKVNSSFSKTERYDTSMNYLVLDDQFARKDIGWAPEISLREGLKGYINE